MAELDAFEVRLESAVRRYLDDAPVEVDGAAVARRVAADRSWRRRLLPDARSLARVPRVAWVLAVLALTILAVVVALFAGARPERPLLALVPPVAVTTCPAGSTPDEPGPVDQDRPIDAIRMAFIAGTGRIIALEADLQTMSWTTWVFDVCTNTWSRLEPATEPRGVISALVHDVDAGLVAAFGGNRPWVYDPAANAWTERREAPSVWRSRAAYDPATGRVYVRFVYGDGAQPTHPLWTYDVEADAWSPLSETGATPRSTSSAHHVLLAFDRSADRLVAVQAEAPGYTVLFDLDTGTWSATKAPTPAFMTGLWPSGGEMAYDEGSRRTVVFSAGTVAAFDATADRWDVLQTGDGPGQTRGPGDRIGHWMAYDPLNERLVVAGGQYPAAEGWVRADDVWVLDPVTGEWTELLAPSRVERYDEATDSWIDLASQESVSPATTD